MSSRSGLGSSPPSRGGTRGPSAASSRRGTGASIPSRLTSASKPGTAGSTTGSNKKGASSKKKKKKKKAKPILEEPKFVRDLIMKVNLGDAEWVRNFLTSPEYIGKYDMNQTAGEALVQAAAKNHGNIVQILLEAGANPNLANGKALQRASLNGAVEACEALLNGGGDPNCASDFAAYVPLHYAAQVGSLPVVRVLLDRGATVDLPCHADQCGPFNGWNALHFAADGGHLPVVQALLDAGAQIDAPNSNGDTPLSIAAERGQWDVLRWLVAAGANIHAARRGLSVVQWCIYRASAPSVQFLVSYGAHPALDGRAMWFPESLTLKQVIYQQFSESVYDEIDLAIYRGGKQALEREAKKKLIASLQWETAPVFDPYSFDTTPTTQIRSFPPHIVAMIASYEM